MDKKQYIHPKDWTIECGDYLSQCDDYEVQHQKLLKKDKIYRLTLKWVASAFAFTVFMIILTMVSKL